MQEYEEYNRKRLIDFDPKMPFPLRLVTLIAIGSFFYFTRYGISLSGVFG